MLEPGQRSRDCHRSRRKRRVRSVDKWPQAHSEARRPSETIASARARDSEPQGSMYPHCGWPLRPTLTLHHPSEPTRRRRRQAPPPLCHLGRFLGPQPTATRGMTTELERTPLALDHCLVPPRTLLAYAASPPRAGLRCRLAVRSSIAADEFKSMASAHRTHLAAKWSHVALLSAERVNLAIALHSAANRLNFSLQFIRPSSLHRICLIRIAAPADSGLCQVAATGTLTRHLFGPSAHRFAN